MIRAAGILFVVGETALFLRRGNGSSAPNLWACPGGHIEGEETAAQAAVRETLEEAGREVAPADLQELCRTVTAPAAGVPAVEGQVPAEPEEVDFTTFVVYLDEQFTPKLCDEHDGFAWAPTASPPQPLHPGVQVALNMLKANELGIARMMAYDGLVSPQRYQNMWLFSIRITGTGVSYRSGRKEFVWRDPAVYMNDDFLARCNGLQVLWEHPDNALLNSKEFEERTIGSVFLPYFRADKPDEVWAIAKIYDEKAAKSMAEEVMSTSPGVNFGDPTVNDRVRLEDGRIMLIEGDPDLLDHIAVCPMGVWDKGGPATGVESITAVADANDAGTLFVEPQPQFNNLGLLAAHAAAFGLAARVNTFH
jgi:8-oxo-dGTP pyrophosphatase MutT (NUDIX family)